MANIPLPNPGQIEIWRSILRDDRGYPVLMQSAKHQLIMQPGKTPKDLRNNEYFQLTNGKYWNITMIKDHPVGSCDLCRYPPLSLLPEQPTHGICSLEKMKMCDMCHTLCCPKHTVKLDRHCFCTRCVKSYRLKKRIWSILRPIFFTRGR